ncbi:MAG: hypothetical protein IJ215_03315 [Clostridia bacterium]|nr:hypothetical protein [Clostridia bacterium]
MSNAFMPVGDYDKNLESSEALSIYEGSRFVRFIKDTLAGFKYGTKNNPKVKGNTVSYIDQMGRLITQEKTVVDGENRTKIEKIVRKISTSAKTEAFNSIEVIEKKRNDKNELYEQVRNFYPSIEDYEERAYEPKIREITYYKNNETYLRKTIERLISEDEMRKRFEIGAIKLNPLAPDSVKKEIIKSKIIYTVDKQKRENQMDEKLKPFGTHLQINETEKTYITLPDLNPEIDELKEYVGPKEFEKDVILYASNEPKARIEEMDNITFSVGKIHHISTSIANYPDSEGNYGGEGRGTYAVYDDKILHATGNKSLSLVRNKDGKIEVSTNSKKDIIASAELRGTKIAMDINIKDKNKAREFVTEVADTYKEKWGITKGTTIEYTLCGNEENQYKVKYQDLKKPTAPKNEAKNEKVTVKSKK